ncbi:type II toxin-antitoxin system tRNA(fMet)-specific endonuclease VapC [Geoalkalibacter halelectricus]|uniref:type II toxin-antitoxin system tRNA(fMet)-specific endonuclease VapC n=1 Tax=Geoalkalibacter halelectricus TaxID=2847045 RepID=UPI003D1EB967
MLWMLDTNICSYILRERPLQVKEHFEEVGPDHLAISSTVLAELYYGAARHPKHAVIRREIDDFASRLTIIPWDEHAAHHYGDIRATLEKNGCPIGAMDLMIAAHARSLDATLVSNNLKHFQNVPDLLLENWAE